MRVEFFYAGIKAQWKEGGGMLLGDNADGGGRRERGGAGWAVMLQPIMFQCVAVWTSTGLPCTYIVDHTNTEFPHAQNSTWTEYFET
jgi:hypothetical protein